jgi:hypothetical protein
MLDELRSQLQETQASLAMHINKVCALEDIPAEHEYYYQSTTFTK